MLCSLLEVIQFFSCVVVQGTAPHYCVHREKQVSVSPGHAPWLTTLPPSRPRQARLQHGSPLAVPTWCSSSPTYSADGEAGEPRPHGIMLVGYDAYFVPEWHPQTLPRHAPLLPRHSLIIGASSGS